MLRVYRLLAAWAAMARPGDRLLAARKPFVANPLS
jgi:hypothetical protein